MSAAQSNALASARHARLSADRTLGTRLRDAFREPHPFARNPATLKPHPVPWLSVYGKRTLRTFGVLVPLAMVVFGWPFAAKVLVNLSNQVHAAPKKATQMEQHHEPARSHKIARRAMLQEGPVRLEA